MGLRRLRQLFAAPRASLAQRFGSGLLEHLDRMRGDRAAIHSRCIARRIVSTCGIELAYDVE